MPLGFNEIDLLSLKSEERRAWELRKFLSGNQVLLLLHGLPDIPLMKVIIKISITGKKERSWQLTPQLPFTETGHHAARNDDPGMLSKLKDGRVQGSLAPL